MLASVLVFAAGFATTSVAGIAGLGGTLTGTDAFKETMASRTARGKLKKKVVGHGKDAVGPVIAFGTGAAADSGPFTITSYESFPVTGTWTLAANNRVTLAVDAAAFAAQKGPELCPTSCVPTATWVARSAKFNPTKQTLKAKWLITVQQTNADGSYVRETFAFKGAGPLAP